MVRGLMCGAIATIAVGAAAPVLAQAAAPTAGDAPAAGVQPAATPGAANGRITYPVAYFTQFAPSTALQIVQRVPGFTIEETDQNVRGFGQAAGNVVINGQRPSAKTDTLQTILDRIPATRVLRVEVGPGELFGAEYAAKAQVLNLVLSAEGGLAGTASATVRRDFTGRVLPGGSVSALVKRGNSTFNVAGTVTNEQTSEEGYDKLFAEPSGALLEYRRKTNRIKEPYAAVTASWDYDGGTYRKAHANLRYAPDRFELLQASHVIPTGGTPRDDALNQYFNADDYELGGDVTQPFAGGGLKLIGLATRRNRDNRELSLIGIDAPGTTGFSQLLNDRLDERLGRVVWNRPALLGWTVEVGGEAVVNTLKSRVDLFQIAANGAQTRIDLPVDDVTVKERRGEAFVNVGRALSKTARLDLGLTYERSHLTVTGDTAAARTLQFWKPSATFDWRPSKWHAQFSVKRTVAQLQFGDFVSSAELASDRVNAGNPDLVPQRAWEALLTVERPILGDGLAKLEVGYNRVSQVQDRVPTPDGFDAPGNLGSGTVFIVRPRLDAPLGRFGIKGGRLNLYVSYVHTSVRDPYTLDLRPFSGNSALYYEASFRQDRGKFAWGASLENNTQATTYRLNELDTRFTDPFTVAFAEYRPDKLTTVRFEARNALQASGGRRRLFFTPDRRSPEPFAREVRYRNQHIVPVLTIKRNFGG